MSRIIATLVVVMLCGCGWMTIAPKPIKPTQVRFDQNSQNAGVIDCDKNGCLVTPGWMGRYRTLEKEFNSYIPADNQIVTEGPNYRVSYEVSNHFADMRAAERGP